YLEDKLGLDAAMALWRMAENAKAHLKRLIADHAIACDFKPGMLGADHKPRYVALSHAYVEKLKTRYGYPHAEAVSKAELDAMLGAVGYHGGMLDRDGWHLHPLNFALGLARAALAKGTRIYEHSKALNTQTIAGKAVVATAEGRVTAD